jgi:hypothetical protein
MTFLRRIPIDLVALVVITLAMMATHLPIILHGMQWNDPAWYFHFGNRLVHGEVPFRDYIFQVGPLPIFLDAGFQEIFGERYAASMYVGLATKIVRVGLIFMIARRLAGWHVAALLATFCALDGAFGWIHHWSTPDSHMFLLLSGLFFVVASRAEGRRALAYLFLAGASAGFVVATRQSTAIVLGATLLGASSIMLWRKEYFTPKRYAALWAGFLVGFALIFIVLAALGALGPAIQQMFLDAPRKKNVSGIASIIDALSGGSLGQEWQVTWFGFVRYLAFPAALVGITLYAVSRRGTASSSTIAMLVIPIGVVVGMIIRHSWLSPYSDGPRMALMGLSALAVLFPARLRDWLGLEPLVVIGAGTVPLASDWANEMSMPGPGWGDSPPMIVGIFLLVFASARLAPRLKLAIAGLLATMGLAHYAIWVDADINPFTKDTATEGTLTANAYEDPHPMLRGMKLTAARVATRAWLASHVPPGSTCFMYGNTPAVYDLLGCKNPTKVDTVIADFLTAEDARQAIETLRANPPDFIIAHEHSFTNPSLFVDLIGRVQFYSPLNSDSSRELHVGLRSILDQYEVVGGTKDQLGYERFHQIEWAWDTMGTTWLYRRKR